MIHDRPATLRRARLAGIVAVAVILAIAASGTALAAKGGGRVTTTSSLTGPVMVVDSNGNGKADRGDSITFDVSTTATTHPEVGLRCYQGGRWVYDAYVGYYDGYLFNPWFTLDSNYWEAGATTQCDARLFYNDKRGRQKVLATMSFNVGG